MKFTSVNEVNDFLKIVNECNGSVWLESTQGDRFVLNSVLSHYIAISIVQMAHDETAISPLSIRMIKNYSLKRSRMTVWEMCYQTTKGARLRKYIM